MTVGAYAFTRESEKWTDSGAQESYGGHLFLYAWHALPAGLWLAGVFCLAQVSFPAAVVDTFKWVLAAYTGSKASGRWRGLKQGTLPPAAEVLTPEQYLARHALRHGAMLLGVVCWLDCALEAFTMGEWHFAPGLYQCYAYSLSAYAATRQWEKWTDAKDQDSHWGGLFVGAWLGLVAAITLWRATHHSALWPENLNFAVGTVLAVFAGSKVSVGLRDQKAKDWGMPAPKPLPQAPDPVQAGEAVGTTKPVDQPEQRQPANEEDKREPEPETGEPKAHKRPVSRENVNPRAAAAAKELDHFQVGDFTARMPCESDEAAHGFIGVLIRAKLVHNEGHGWYKWIGD